MRLVRSKLHKRDEMSSPITKEKSTMLHINFDPPRSDFSHTYQHEQHISSNETVSNGFFIEHKHVSFVRTSGITMANIMTKEFTSINNKWVFPPKAPTPNICNRSDDEALDTTDEKHSLKGLRKQFSGRFKRFVAKKSEETPTIPPELKPQLKTIYVY
ncbi:uncharacterized protein LOC129253290 [Anastrepha obliqua]|uniref:uncharacterized protein LOC129253290 n=1 Tax=Anastrepha obliqua TaxID=95512 RepID=UPI00240A5EBA|nr:uncharacterized protein LOC129253290 [Anastrepha obliqua]